MIRSSNGNIFFELRLNKRMCKQSIRRWLEMPSPSLWRHCNALLDIHKVNVVESISMSRRQNVIHNALKLTVLSFPGSTGYSIITLYKSNGAWRCPMRAPSKSNRCLSHMTGSTSALLAIAMGRRCHEWDICRWPVIYHDTTPRGCRHGNKVCTMRNMWLVMTWRR